MRGAIIIYMDEYCDNVVALAGNPNVGKSTVFNSLTGLRQHTGNWTGKTVSNAFGRFIYNNRTFTLVDLPGTYSLSSSSEEERVARDFICFEKPDAVIIVLDSTCLERNLNLALQILEVTKKAVVCLNLIDEARKKRINIDVDELSLQLGVPVIATNARAKKGIKELCDNVFKIINEEKKTYNVQITYDERLEKCINIYYSYFNNKIEDKILARFFSIKMLDCEEKFISRICDVIGINENDNEFIKLREAANKQIDKYGLNKDRIKDLTVEQIVLKSEDIYNKCVTLEDEKYNKRDRRVDKTLTSKSLGIPIMLILLGLILWLTIVGANYPSQLLTNFFDYIKSFFYTALQSAEAPIWLISVLIDGIYSTTATVVSVMLPPMAIFFPLFTILEDVGYLPRIAFNMDKYFKKAGAHGKQALTMCMGFGCNACAVTGCRIIDSPRERLIAILTNSLVPCNGRFPALIALITIFFTGTAAVVYRDILGAVLLLLVLVLSVFVTLAVSKLLSKTMLKGTPSSFALELPPYRRPQIGKIIVRSILDRTLFVLGRAVAVAAPAGLIIWLLANIYIGDAGILKYCTDFLDPFAQLMGLDGVILMAFILGFPANEIVIPIMIMAYMSTGVLTDFNSLTQLHTLLMSNGWTITTAICTIIFYLFHFPCSTTCITIYKETKSIKWTALAFLIPAILGISVCILVNLIINVFL